MHLIIWYWGQTIVQGVENDLGLSLCFWPRPKVGERKAKEHNSVCQLQHNGLPRKYEEDTSIFLFSSPQKPCLWKSYLEFPWTQILTLPYRRMQVPLHQTFQLPHSLMWSLSSQLPEPYLFNPTGIHPFLSDINYVCINYIYNLPCWLP